MSAKRILIVEDEKPIRDMIAFGLRRAGYEVREAEDCRRARIQMADQVPRPEGSLARTSKRPYVQLFVVLILAEVYCEPRWYSL